MTLPRLPSLRDKHELISLLRGPTPESNWVIPGVLMAGAYPGSMKDQPVSVAYDTMHALLEIGFDTFVCLEPDIEIRQRAHPRPYMTIAQQLLTEGSKNTKIKYPTSVRQFKYAFEDGCCVPSDKKLDEWIETLVSCINQGQKLYIHCWAGRGRTGIFIAILLAKLYNLPAQEALKRTQISYDTRLYHSGRSPERNIQRQQVVRYLKVKQIPHSANSPSLSTHNTQPSPSNKENWGASGAGAVGDGDDDDAGAALLDDGKEEYGSKSYKLHAPQPLSLSPTAPKMASGSKTAYGSKGESESKTRSNGNGDGSIPVFPRRFPNSSARSSPKPSLSLHDRRKEKSSKHRLKISLTPRAPRVNVQRSSKWTARTPRDQRHKPKSPGGWQPRHSGLNSPTRNQSPLSQLSPFSSPSFQSFSSGSPPSSPTSQSSVGLALLPYRDGHASNQSIAKNMATPPSKKKSSLSSVNRRKPSPPTMGHPGGNEPKSPTSRGYRPKRRV